VSSNPSNADIVVDGVASGLTNIWIDLAPGPHEIEVTRDGYHDEDTEVVLRPGQRRRVHFDMVESTIWNSPWFWTAFGLVVAGAGLWAFLELRPQPGVPGGNIDPPVVAVLRSP
jgi:hypothetical protein